MCYLCLGRKESKNILRRKRQFRDVVKHLRASVGEPLRSNLKDLQAESAFSLQLELAFHLNTPSCTTYPRSFFTDQRQNTMVFQRVLWNNDLQLLLRATTKTLLPQIHRSQVRNLNGLSKRVLSPILNPPTFHDYLRLCSAQNMLLLLLFTTSACAPCRTITPLLTDLIERRQPTPSDRFGSLAFAELELDSPDTSNGRTSDLGVEYGISSIPTLAGFGGRRAERITERLTDTKMMADLKRMQTWVDEQMAKGDPQPPSGDGILKRLFG